MTDRGGKASPSLIDWVSTGGFEMPIDLDGFRRLVWRNELTPTQVGKLLEAQRHLEQVWKETAPDAVLSDKLRPTGDAHRDRLVRERLGLRV